MRNLIGYLKKTLYLYSLFVLFSPTQPISANETFDINSQFEHEILTDSISTSVIITLESNIPRVLSYYTASIPVGDLRTVCSNAQTNTKYDCTNHNRGSTTDTLIDLRNAVITPNSPLEIQLSYITPTEQGNSYSIPSKVLDTTTSSVRVRYPKGYGEPLWSSDSIASIRAISEQYEVVINKPFNQNISLLFGESILYRFEINKVFSNTLGDENQTFEIYVPSDSYGQVIIWEEISPLPNIALQDQDGNYIFKYIVAPDSTVDVKVTGYIQKVSIEKQEDIPNAYFLEETGYWSITDSTEFLRVNTYLQKKGLDIGQEFESIDDLDSSEREILYKYVYKYVTERLAYPEDTTLGITNQSRLGASSITEEAHNSTSIDYSDYYIALLRAYDIPARMVIGYISNITGYTSDGFYHHWVQYFDSNQNRWITADPFLEEYFEKDLYGSEFHDHISIITRGRSAVAPKLSFFKETDFVVSSVAKGTEPSFEYTADISFEESRITDQYAKGYLYISNTGNLTISGYNIDKTSIENIQRYTDPTKNLSSQIILPKQSTTVQFNVPIEEIDSTNTVLGVNFFNTAGYEKISSLETEIEKNVPVFVSLLAKILSIAIFSAFVFLIYFGIKIIRKKING